MPPFDGVVLCGGASRRMGTDKSLLAVDGRPMAGRVAAALAAAGAQHVVAVGGHGRALTSEGLDWLADDWPGEGPLGGIVTALRAAGTAPTVVVLACDLVAPDPAAVTRLVAHGHETGADVVVPVVEGREQWLHAAWDRRVGRLLGDVFASGERSVVGACLGLAVARVGGFGADVAADADAPEDLPGPARR